MDKKKLKELAVKLASILCTAFVLSWSLAVIAAAASAQASWLYAPLAGFNFIVHESGHLFASASDLGIVEAFSGTILELLVLALFVQYVLRQRTALGYVFSAAWISYTFIFIGRYMTDATTMQLQLFGLSDLNGFQSIKIHDWQVIFNELHLIDLAHNIGLATAIIGLIIAVPLWFKGFQLAVRG